MDEDEETDEDDLLDGVPLANPTTKKWNGPPGVQGKGRPATPNSNVRLPDVLKWARKVFGGKLEKGDENREPVKILLGVKKADPQKFLAMLQQMEKEHRQHRYRYAANPKAAASESTAASGQNQKATDDLLAANSIAMIGELLSEAALESQG